MATLYITEFNVEAQDPNSRTLEIAEWPALAQQIVAITSSSVSSSAFQGSTRYVRVVGDASCSINFNAAATASTAFLPSGIVEYHGIPQGQSYYISAITNT